MKQNILHGKIYKPHIFLTRKLFFITIQLRVLAIIKKTVQNHMLVKEIKKYIVSLRITNKIIMKIWTALKILDFKHQFSNVWVNIM